jgi:hypothetical protein
VLAIVLSTVVFLMMLLTELHEHIPDVWPAVTSLQLLSVSGYLAVVWFPVIMAAYGLVTWRRQPELWHDLLQMWSMRLCLVGTTITYAYMLWATVVGLLIGPEQPFPAPPLIALVPFIVAFGLVLVACVLVVPEVVVRQRAQRGGRDERRRDLGARAPGEGEAASVPVTSGSGIFTVLVLVVVVAVAIIAAVANLLDNGPWGNVSSPTSAELYDVALVSPAEGWAVGAGGTILHYHGGSWSTVSSPVSADLEGVAMVSPTEGWAVGGTGMGGTIVHYHDGSWSKVSNPAQHILHGVSMVAPTEGWAVGEAGTILHYTGGSWYTVSSPHPRLLFSVAMVSPTEGWAVGRSGTIAHYTGGQ